MRLSVAQVPIWVCSSRVDRLPGDCGAVGLAQLLFDARRRGLEVPTRRSPPDPAWLEKGVGYGLNLDVPAVPGHLATEERPKRCRQLLASIPTNVCSAL